MVIRLYYLKPSRNLLNGVESLLYFLQAVEPLICFTQARSYLLKRNI
ncbi:MAG: hypothetical protein ACJASB_000157 [Shewanella psychromarinicola]|jgi:hypothetical protein